MNTTEIKPQIYWVGVTDPDLRHFHGYTFDTPNGTTYNSYLILDKEITLVDGVYTPFTDEWLGKIRSLTDLSAIKHLIVNHIEPDHSGSLPELLKLVPNVKIYGTAKCLSGLTKMYGLKDLNFTIVKTGDEIKIGARTIKFLEATMIHWPDSMFSYIPEDKLLLPNDGFGQHYSTPERFDDEVDLDKLINETKTYYAGILWPFSTIIKNKLAEIEKLGWQIDMIAPSHGLIWRKNVNKIWQHYLDWSEQKLENKAVIVFETMWGATEIMAGKIAKGLDETGVKVKVMDVNKFSRVEIASEMFSAKAYIIGSSVHDTGVLPNMSALLHYLKGMRPAGRIGMAFGSYGWGPTGTKEIENFMLEARIEKVMESYNVQFTPDASEMEKCKEIGREMGKLVVSRQ